LLISTEWKGVGKTTWVVI